MHIHKQKLKLRTLAAILLAGLLEWPTWAESNSVGARTPNFSIEYKQNSELCGALRSAFNDALVSAKKRLTTSGDHGLTDFEISDTSAFRANGFHTPPIIPTTEQDFRVFLVNGQKLQVVAVSSYIRGSEQSDILIKFPVNRLPSRDDLKTAFDDSFKFKHSVEGIEAQFLNSQDYGILKGASGRFQVMAYRSHTFIILDQYIHLPLWHDEVAYVEIFRIADFGKNGPTCVLRLPEPTARRK